MSAHLSKTKEKPEGDDLRAIVAWNVRRFRTLNKLSQEQLAFEANLDRTYVSALERRIWNVSLSNIERLARALSVPPWQLLYLPENVSEERQNKGS